MPARFIARRATAGWRIDPSIKRVCQPSNGAFRHDLAQRPVMTRCQGGAGEFVRLVAKGVSDADEPPAFSG
jgi:hypothetical protein